MGEAVPVGAAAGGEGRRPGVGGRRTALALSGLVLGGLLLAGCGHDTVRAAPDAADPGCTALMATLPATVLGRPRRSLDVQGTAEWGDPAIVLNCGVAQPGPTTDHCLSANDVDWVFSQSKSYYQFVSFGRAPATEVRVPISINRTTAPDALIDLNDVVNLTKKTSQHCID